MTAAPANSRITGLARGPFILAVVAVYALSFLSQVLLSAPVTSRASVVPFVVVQIALIWFWIVLHRRRLRDAGRPTGIVIGIALVYVLEVVLLTLLIWILTSASGKSGTGDFAGETAGIFHLFAILYLMASLSGDASLGVLQAWLIGFAAMMFLPVLIAIGFSIWAATRPSVPAPP